jgi:hypothetical protein
MVWAFEIFVKPLFEKKSGFVNWSMSCMVFTMNGLASVKLKTRAVFSTVN